MKDKGEDKGCECVDMDVREVTVMSVSVAGVIWM